MQTEFKNLDLQAAVDVLQNLSRRKLDIVAPIGHLEMSMDGHMVLPYTSDSGGGVAALTMNSHAVTQVANKMAIPGTYFRKCLQDDGGLAAINYNHWARREWEKGQDKARRMLVRAYLDDNKVTGQMRAFLSDSYGTYDNLSVLTTVIEAVGASGVNFKVDDLSLTETNFYVRFSAPEIVERVPELLRSYRDPNGGEYGGTGEDDGICIGFELRNSEVGAGKLSVSPLLKVFACANRMVFREGSFDRKHLGAKMDEGEMTPAIQAKNWELIQVQVSETLRQICSPDYIGQRVEDLRAMSRHRIMNAQKVCNGLGSADFALPKETIEGVLNNFLRAAYESYSEPTAWHLAQAITAQAHGEEPTMRSWMESLSTRTVEIARRFDTPEN